MRKRMADGYLFMAKPESNSEGGTSLPARVLAEVLATEAAGLEAAGIRVTSGPGEDVDAGAYEVHVHGPAAQAELEMTGDGTGGFEVLHTSSGRVIEEGFFERANARTLKRRLERCLRAVLAARTDAPPALPPPHVQFAKWLRKAARADELPTSPRVRSGAMASAQPVRTGDLYGPWVSAVFNFDYGRDVLLTVHEDGECRLEQRDKRQGTCTTVRRHRLGSAEDLPGLYKEALALAVSLHKASHPEAFWGGD